MRRQPLLAAFSLLTFLCHCAVEADHETPPPPTIELNEEGRNSDTPLCANVVMPEYNISYTCAAQNGTVLWLLGDYAMVDRDQFLISDRVLIEDQLSPPASDLTLYPDGISFLFDSFKSTIVYVSCQVVFDEISIVRSNDVLTIYQDFPPVEQPEWEVTSCDSDGNLSLTITYQFDGEGVCAKSPLSYRLTLSDGNGNEYEYDGSELKFEVKIDIVYTRDLVATLTIFSEDIWRDTVTELTGVTCNAATIGLCQCTGDSCDNTRLACNSHTDTDTDKELWGCQFNNYGLVVDVYDGKPVNNGQTRVPDFDEEFNCFLSDGNGDDGGEIDKLVVAAAIGGAVGGVVLLVGVVIVIVVVILCCYHKGGKRRADSSEKQNLELSAQNPASKKMEYEGGNTSK